MESNDLKHFLDSEGRLTAWPAKIKKQMLALQYLAEQLEWDRQYTEQDINEFLNKFHTFDDAALLRRELYMKHFLDRKPDGSAYWKTLRQLPAKWKSERLIIRDAVEKDLPELRKVYNECAYIGDLTGYHDESYDPMLAEFRGEALPPNGKRELQRLQLILESTTQDIIGYLVSYHGFPDHGTFWIATLAIRPEFQRQKFGKEVIHKLASQLLELGTYKQIGICVGVGNDPAMKFWAGCGFEETINTVHRGVHSDEWRIKHLHN